MRIVVACELPAESLDQIRALGSTFTHLPAATGEILREQIADIGILVVDQFRISTDLIQRGRMLQMIIRAGTGPGGVALEEASAQGIFVSHCPFRHAIASAELALGLIIALDRKIVEHAAAMRAGRSTRGEPGGGRGLAGRKLGIVGFSPVGERLAERARALGMQVLAWTGPTSRAAEDAGVQFVGSRRELARQADVVVVDSAEVGDHSTIVEADFFPNLRPGALFVHLGHAAAVDENALWQAAQSGKIALAIDAYQSGGAPDAPAGAAGAPPKSGATRREADLLARLAGLPNVILTPQLAPHTDQARNAVGAEVVRIIQNYLISGEPTNCLNVCERSPATWQLVVRVRDQVGVFASILDAIRADGVNAEEISSRVFVGAKAAWLTLNLTDRPSTDALDAIRKLSGVLHLDLRAVV